MTFKKIRYKSNLKKNLLNLISRAFALQLFYLQSVLYFANNCKFMDMEEDREGMESVIHIHSGKSIEKSAIYRKAQVFGT